MKHEIRNHLTEHQNNYKLCNVNLMSCYSGLYPASLTKLSFVIFGQLLSNKVYYKKDSQFYDKSEDKRIHTNIPITANSLLESCHPIKYTFEKKDMTADAGNITKKVLELDENNIFYCWRYGYPKYHIFVLERDIGLWKYYNPSGCVVPKTLKKIILLTKSMTMSMHKIVLDETGKADIHDIRTSFCEFLDHMIGKMNPEVAKKLDRWTIGRGYKEYVTALHTQVSALDPYEGLIEDEFFYNRLPPEVSDKLLVKKRQLPDSKNLESELVPENDSLLKTKKTRKKREKIPVVDAVAEFEKFKKVDPLENAKQFVMFHRSSLKTKLPQCKFYAIELEVKDAALVLDLMRQNNKFEKDFLISWINYYIEVYLKGNNAMKEEKTSIDALKKTFQEYSNKYIGCGV